MACCFRVPTRQATCRRVELFPCLWRRCWPPPYNARFDLARAGARYLLTRVSQESGRELDKGSSTWDTVARSPLLAFSLIVQSAIAHSSTMGTDVVVWSSIAGRYREWMMRGNIARLVEEVFAPRRTTKLADPNTKGRVQDRTTSHCVTGRMVLWNKAVTRRKSNLHATVD